MLTKAKSHLFLFSQLVLRDFKKKYKRTYLGMVWSVLAPLLTLLIMRLVFTQFFGNSIEHYTTFLFCGNIVFSFFSDATGSGMGALMNNADIFSKINVPKYLFLLSSIVSSLINFALTFLVFLAFCILDGVTLHLSVLSLLLPILCLILFNVGIGLILSALFLFFRDVQYLWSVFTLLLTYLSAIFYDPSELGAVERNFYLNPLFTYIKFFRIAVLDGRLPPTWHVLLSVFYALAFFAIGVLIYQKNNHRFLYYV